jgi:hypothetical protein
MIAASAAVFGALLAPLALAGLAIGAIVGHKWVLPRYLRRYHVRKGVPPAEM